MLRSKSSGKSELPQTAPSYQNQHELRFIPQQQYYQQQQSYQQQQQYPHQSQRQHHAPHQQYQVQKEGPYGMG